MHACGEYISSGKHKHAKWNKTHADLNQQIVAIRLFALLWNVHIIGEADCDSVHHMTTVFQHNNKLQEKKTCNVMKKLPFWWLDCMSRGILIYIATEL